MTQQERIQQLEAENRELLKKQIELLNEIIKLKDRPKEIQYIPYPVYHNYPWWYNQPWYTGQTITWSSADTKSIGIGVSSDDILTTGSFTYDKNGMSTLTNTDGKTATIIKAPEFNPEQPINIYNGILENAPLTNEEMMNMPKYKSAKISNITFKSHLDDGQITLSDLMKKIGDK